MSSRIERAPPALRGDLGTDDREILAEDVVPEQTRTRNAVHAKHARLPDRKRILRRLWIAGVLEELGDAWRRVRAGIQPRRSGALRPRNDRLRLAGALVGAARSRARDVSGDD